MPVGQKNARVVDGSFNPEGNRIVLGKMDGTAEIWLMDWDDDGIPDEEQTAEQRLEMVFSLVTTNSDQPVNVARFMPDGRKIVTATAQEKEFVVWLTLDDWTCKATNTADEQN